MGLPIATLTSVGFGVCTCHESPISESGTVVQGSGSVFAAGLGVSHIGDIIVGSCGHTGTIVSGASTVIADGISVAVLSSSFVGCYSGQILTGASTVLGS